MDKIKQPFTPEELTQLEDIKRKAVINQQYAMASQLRDVIKAIGNYMSHTWAAEILAEIEREIPRTDE